MKRNRILILLLALILLLGGCSGEEPALYTTADAQALLDAGVFDGVMEPVDSFVVSMLYGIPEENIAECACYLALDTSSSADELTVLVMKDEAAAEAAEVSCRERLESQAESYALYCPDQVPRIQEGTLLRRENTILLAVGSTERLPQALEKLGLNG